jgi:hypothetical protein
MSIETTIDTYLQAYGEPDAKQRADLIAQSWATNGHLIDPPLDGTGHEGLSTMFATVQGQFAGHTFRRSTMVDEHHGIARYGWELVAPDGSVTLAGMDVAEIDLDGKLAKVAGFFGDLVAR